MPSWSEHSHPDWVESSFDRDVRDSERWMRLDDDEERERDLIDRLVERGGVGPVSPGKPKDLEEAA